MIQFLMGASVAANYMLVAFMYERRQESKAYNILSFFFMALLIESLGCFMQITFDDILSVSNFSYEYIISLGRAFAPTLILLFAFVYENPRVDLRKYLWLLIIPMVIILMIWTNPLHKLFYTNYISVMGTNGPGVLYYVYIVAMYAQSILAILLIIRSSVDKTGFLSPQTILILIASLIPFVPRFIFIASNMGLPEYMMPVSYLFMTSVLAIAIIKFNVFDAFPIALKSVINIMSDAFVVLNIDGNIVDMNRSFENKFSKIMNLKENKNMFDVIKYEGIKDLKKLKDQILEAQEIGDIVVDEYHLVKKDYDRYFEIQIQPIRARTTNGYIATLLVFRDVTEQKGNVDVIVKKESLSIIGELAGGVAHDINTPITAIRSGLLMLKNTVKTNEEKQMIESMSNSADKISNLVNGLKNQIRNLGNNSDTEFSITSLIQDIQILMHNQLSKNNVRLDLNFTQDIWITGNTAKLTQVITNIIENSVNAYGKKGGIIDVNVYRNEDTDVVIMIEDWAGGIPEQIRPYIFKRIIRINDMPTTGVGLYLAYSVIKGSFGGDITLDTKTGRGTRIYITLPNS